MIRQLGVAGFVITCVGDGEASSQVAHGGAGAQPRLSGQGVTVVLSLSTHSTH